MQVNHETFSQTSEELVTHRAGSFVKQIGTVEVLFKNQSLTVKAEKIDSTIYLKGFFGRYQTSSKQWEASVSSEIFDGKERVCAFFGRDDRSGKFNKIGRIFYKPE